MKPLTENEFAILATRSENDGNHINYIKLTFDGSKYFKIPKEIRSSKLPYFELIVSSSHHNSFLKYVNSQIKAGQDSGWSRHYRFKIKERDGNLTKEARLFMNDNHVPIVSGNKLIEETTETNDSKKEEDALDLSFNELSKLFGKFILNVLNSVRKNFY